MTDYTNRGYIHQFTDEASGASVRVVGSTGGLPMTRAKPTAVLVEANGELRTLNEFTHTCPCCGTETKVGEW